MLCLTARMITLKNILKNYEFLSILRFIIPQILQNFAENICMYILWNMLRLMARLKFSHYMINISTTNTCWGVSNVCGYLTDLFLFLFYFIQDRNFSLI